MRSVLRAVGHCLSEARPSVQVIFLFRFLAGAVLSDPAGLPHPWRTAVAAAGWCCATVAVYVFNGITDYAEDVRNGSRRPIASGRLPMRHAVRAVLGLTLLSLVTAAVAGSAMLALTCAYLVIGWAYSAGPFPLKSAFHTCILGGLGLGLATYTAGMLAGSGRTTPALLAFAGFMSLWMGGVGGIAKDFSDVQGDRAVGRRTLPVLLGDARARLLLGVVAATVALGFGATVLSLGAALRWCCAVLLLGAVTLVAVSGTVGVRADRSSRRRPYRVFMCTQHCAHLVLGLSVAAFVQI